MKKILLISVIIILGLTQLYPSNFPGFIENKGQIIDQDYNPNTEVLFLYASGSIRIQLKENGFSYEIIRTDKIADENIHHMDHFQHMVHRIDIYWIGSNTNIEVAKFGESKDYINYYTASTSNDESIQAHYFSKVIFKNVYDDIDFEFTIESGQPKYNILLHPGADISKVKLKFEGSDDIQITDNKLVITTSLGNIEDNIPYSYQVSGGDNIPVQYIDHDNFTFGFQINGQYDPNETLIIDPIPSVVWSTYYGGVSLDVNRDIIDASSNHLVVTGYSASNTNIATAGAFQNAWAGGYDAMLIKFDTNGVRQWATYYGGTLDDYSFAIDQNSNGDIFMVGQTMSNTNIANGGFQNAHAGGTWDVFLVKFSAAGNRIWGTYYGGANQDLGYGVTVDGNGDILITGWVDLPYAVGTLTTAGTHQPNPIGAANHEAFLAKFATNGARIWGTYYGGTGGDRANLVTVDNNNNIYIAGETMSATNIAFNNAHINAYQDLAGQYDAFLAKFNPNGTIAWGTYIGGTTEDRAFGIEFDGYQSIIVTGITTSNTGLATAGAFQGTNSGGGGDGFICRFHVNGNISWKTYYGGSAYDRLYRLDIDMRGNIYASGQTSSNTGIALNGFQNVHSGGSDAFMVIFDSTGVRNWSSYFGNTANDDSWDIYVQGNGYPTNPIYLVGNTSSAAGIATTGAHQTTYAGGGDAYLTKIFWISPLPVELIDFSAECNTDNIIFSWTSIIEINNDYYTLEKSADMLTWQTVARIPGTGNSNVINHYDYVLSAHQVDEKYFRLTQTDFNGEVKSYPPVSIECGYDELTISIYPNPASDFLSLQSNGKIERVEIFDMKGQLVKLIAGNMYHITIADLVPGVYLLNTYVNEQVFRTKIIKS